MPSNTAPDHQASAPTIVALVSSSLERLVKVADRRGDTPGWPPGYKTRDLRDKFRAWVRNTEADSESSPESFEARFSKGPELYDIKEAIAKLGVIAEVCMYDIVLMLFLVLTMIVIEILDRPSFDKEEAVTTGEAFERSLRTLKHMVHD